MFKPEQGNILNPHEINWINKRLTHIEHKKDEGERESCCACVCVQLLCMCVCLVFKREKEREKKKIKANLIKFEILKQI